jgi:hypothetical protein
MTTIDEIVNTSTRRRHDVRSNMRRIIALVCLACAALLPMTVAGAGRAASASPCGKEAWDKFVPDLVAAQRAFVRGDPASMKALWSHAEDVTLMGAWGGHERGWALVGARLDWVSKSNTEGAGSYSYDEVSSIVGSDLALFVQIENIAVPHLNGGATHHLRVTHVMRCEGASWRVVSRHADRLMETTPPPGVKK